MHYLDIVDCNAGDHGKAFATNFNPEINIREITQNGRYWENGQWVETKPLEFHKPIDYPGIGPQHAHLIHSGRAQVYSATDQEALQAALELSRIEGIIPALETAHAFAILGQMKIKEKDIVIVNLSGRGDKDLATFIDYLNDPKGHQKSDH